MIGKRNIVVIMLMLMSALLLMYGVSIPPVHAQSETIRIQILHASDLEGGIDAIQDAPNFAAVVEGLENDASAKGVDSILLSAGDNYLLGPFFGASGDRSMRDVFQSVYETHFGLETGTSDFREAPGRADITVMNLIGFDASALGNHEFDGSTSAMEDIILTDIRGETINDVRWLGAQFPYLSVNLGIANDEGLGSAYTSDILDSSAFMSTPDDLTAAGAAPKFAPATIVMAGDHKIGVIGATTQLLSQLSSPGDVNVLSGGSNDMAALADLIQPQINALASLGIDKIVTVSHLQQVTLEKELAGLLSGVDVMIAGGSDTLSADEEDFLRPGDTAAEPYPLIIQDADGNPVALASTDGQYSYVGRLVVDFDNMGHIVVDSIEVDESGAFGTHTDGVTAVWGDDDPFGEGTKGAAVSGLVSTVAGIVNSKDGIIHGYANVYLEGRREQVRTQETNLGSLTADANLAAVQGYTGTTNVQISIKNGGGIRAEIGTLDADTSDLLPNAGNPAANKPENAISQLDIENSLRFNNSLWVMTLTATELVSVMEHAVAGVAKGATPGSFAQLGGLTMSYNPNSTAQVLEYDDQDNPTAVTIATPGERVKTLSTIDTNGAVVQEIVVDGVLQVDPATEYEIVTLNFLGGAFGIGDGYPFIVYGDNVIETDIGEQEAFADYLSANYGSADTPFSSADTVAIADTRIIATQLPTAIMLTDYATFALSPMLIVAVLAVVTVATAIFARKSE